MKSIKNYEGIYSIDEFGVIYSNHRNKILKPSKTKSNPYLRYNLSKNGINKTYFAHKLVMENFGIEKPKGNYIIDHIDGNQQNNHISNLQWLTISENTEKHYGNKDKKIEILNLYQNGLKAREISEKLGLKYGLVKQTINKSLA